MALFFSFKCFANLLANPSDIAQVEIAVGLARCPDANEGQFRFTNPLVWISGSMQSADFDRLFNDLTNICFNDWALPAVDQSDLCGNRVDSNNVMPVTGEAPCRNCPDITQSEDTDSQDICLSCVAKPDRWCLD